MESQKRDRDDNREAGGKLHELNDKREQPAFAGALTFFIS